MLQYWHEFVKEQGGIFAGPNLLHFGLPQQELSALGIQDCIIPLTTLGTLSFHGVDAKQFLQGQITSNVNDITPQQSGLSAHCNLKGRMQSLFRIFQIETPPASTYHLCMPTEIIDSALLDFKKYALFSKVTIESAQHIVGLGLYGPTADARLYEHIPQTKTLLKPYDCLTQIIGGATYTICRLPGQHPRYDIWAKPEDMSNLWLRLITHCKPVLPTSWELLEIQSGIPTIYQKTIGEILPHHANLSILNGISYTKGCYLGQEIIARMQYKGKIKKHLYRAFIQDSKEKPTPGALVYADVPSNESGIVLRVAENSYGAIELLLVLDDQANNFNNVCLYSADGPKVHRLDLPYSW